MCEGLGLNFFCFCKRDIKGMVEMNDEEKYVVLFVCLYIEIVN